jgi:hypothetical protein
MHCWQYLVNGAIDELGSLGMSQIFDTPAERATIHDRLRSWRIRKDAEAAARASTHVSDPIVDVSVGPSTTSSSFSTGVRKRPAFVLASPPPKAAKNKTGQ